MDDKTKCSRCGQLVDDTTVFPQFEQHTYGQIWCTDCVLAEERDADPLGPMESSRRAVAAHYDARRDGGAS